MSETNTARSFWIQEPGRGQIVTEALPPRKAGEVRVRTLFSGVSRGTESLVFRGRVPRSQWETMRAPFQAGSFPAPVKYGYACVGRVEQAPALGEGAALGGRTVFCLHPHQDRFQVPAAAVRAVPASVPPERAVLAANLETAVNACWDAGPRVGDRVVVVGGGVVGLLTAWLCRQVPGVRLTVVDPDPAREETCRALGLPWSPEPPDEAGADLVVHASGNPDGLAAALAAAGTEATVLELSWYGDRAVPAPLGEAFHHRRLTLRSSQVGRLHPERTPRWTHARRLDLALQLLGDPALDALVSGESPFEELPGVMARLSEPSAGVLCHRIRYRDVEPM
jgi:threonine dehydrogenase-like Zn-dependent dehydrogenase